MVVFLRSGIHTEGRIYGYLLLLPAVALYTLLVVWPIIHSIVLSFQDWNGFAPDRNWVGFQNYTDALQNVRFWRAFLNNLIWGALSVIPVGIGLVIAVVLYMNKIWGSAFFRVSFLLPFTLSGVLTGIIWGWIYNPEWGTINTILRGLGLDALARPWLAEPGISLIAANLVGGWTWFGFCMVIFLAGLQSIPDEIYDAAKIDGASSFQLFTRITVPLLGTYVRMLTIVTIIFSFKVFDLIFVMTQGGPFQTSEVLGFVIYQFAFTQWKIGLASAIGIILTIIVLLASMFSVRREEGY